MLLELFQFYGSYMKQANSTEIPNRLIVIVDIFVNLIVAYYENIKYLRNMYLRKNI